MFKLSSRHSLKINSAAENTLSVMCRNIPDGCVKTSNFVSSISKMHLPLLVAIFNIIYPAVTEVPNNVFQLPVSINVIIGGSVTFYCAFPLFQDNSDLNIFWWKLGENNFLQTCLDSGRYFSTLSKGEATFQLMNVSAADTGVYYCGVKRRDNPLVNGTGSKLMVHVPPSPLRITYNEIKQNGSVFPTIICKTPEFYPEEINITWCKDGLTIETGITTRKALNINGRYEVTSILVEVESVKSGTIYTCQASHPAIKTATDFQFMSTTTGEIHNVQWNVQICGSIGGGLFILLVLIIIIQKHVRKHRALCEQGVFGQVSTPFGSRYTVYTEMCRKEPVTS
ncbi:tyrosine-protein phosphatase non-receptor type substrate 1-like isoform X2 [Hemitrygon akajei]|uniref:tyrosine-protein phosphatase non-receptor type substrate 1-like isoform X2 n=1 Tax=Hemitrygon akajei TaxID=2704970 RepID=UPI003BFA032C